MTDLTNVKTVHVVFKTHLDIGFTDHAKNVMDTYHQMFIPKALELAKQMDGKFIWTTGSWLVYEYLDTANPDEKQKMVEAIQRGHISWHGLPFTTHTEAMSAKLFDFGLSLSRKLDRQFGRRTIAAKMSDVPGHTIAMVSRLAESGIQYLHIGVNSSSKMPEVPELFVWRDGNGNEVIVNYHNSYGDALVIDGFEDVLVFAHTEDNRGPQAIDEVNQVFAALRQKFPGAEVRASTLDAFARRLLTIKGRLPVIYEEIGDSWIHGIGSDPLKLAKYRTLMALQTKWLEEGRMREESEEYERFSSALLLIPEHTWGVDTKKFLTDYENWAKEDFQRARRADAIAWARTPQIYSYLGHHVSDQPEKLSYGYVERSWEEQRGYLERAVQALHADKRHEVERAFEELKPDASRVAVQTTSPSPSPSPTSTSTSTSTHTAYRLGRFTVAFGDDGSIEQLVDMRGKNWAGEGNHLGAYSYQTFGPLDFQIWLEQYHVKRKENQNWIPGDYGKPGLEFVTPRPANRVFRPILQKITVEYGWGAGHHADADIVLVELRMPRESTEENGAPRTVVVEYRFHHFQDTVDVTLSWFGKDANRMPEASWFSFVPQVENPNMWRVDKLGEWISPLTVVRSGNRNMHASETGAKYQGADGIVYVTSVDAPLIAFGEPRLLRFDNTFPDLVGGIHFNLHNNVWGTNFRMWFEEDMKFRFSISLSSF